MTSPIRPTPPRPWSLSPFVDPEPLPTNLFDALSEWSRLEKRRRERLQEMVQETAERPKAEDILLKPRAQRALEQTEVAPVQADVTRARRGQPLADQPLPQATISAQEPSGISKALNVLAQPAVQVGLAGMRFREATESAIGRESAAERARQTQALVEESMGPKSGLAEAVAIPSAFAGEMVPYIAAGGGIPGIVRSAAITGLTSRRPGGSTVEALGELTGSETLQKAAESPLRTPIDVTADVLFNVAPGAVRGVTRGFDEIARLRQGGVGTTRALARQAAQNVAAGARQIGPTARAVGQQLAAEPLTTAALAVGLAGETALPGASALAAALPATTRQPRRGALPTIPQEVRATDRFGYMRAPESYVPDPVLEREHVDNVLRLTDKRLAPFIAKTTEVANGTGLYGGKATPNLLTRFDDAVTDDDIRRTAAIRGLTYGQDQQLWYRRAPRGEPNTTSAIVMTGPAGAPLPQATIDAIINRVRQPDILGEFGGATRDGDHLMFLNLKQYTELDDATFNARINAVVDELADAHQIQPYTDTYYTETLDGTAAYLRTLGRRPDALRAARDAIVDAAPEYRRYAERIGADLADVDARIADRINGLDRLLRQIEQPPPLGRTQGGIPLQEAAQTVYTRFPRILGTTPERVVPEMVTRLDTMVNDLVDQGVIPREMAQDWYRGATLDQRQIAQLALPELREDPKYTLYTVVNSILSSGQEVPVETRQGLNVFNQYLKTGRFSLLNPKEVQYKQALSGGKKAMTGERGEGLLGEAMAASPRSLNIEQALARLDALVQAYGEDGAIQALVGNVPIMAAGGRAVKEERPALVYLFGPKIGQYAMDKLGIPGGGKSTIDLWMARLDYALRGDKAGAAGGKMQDAVSPEMRRRMQQVLAEFATRNNMPESSAQALAWYAIKNAFRNAGAKEKRLAYTTLGSGTTEAMMSPAKDFSTPIAQGLMRGDAYARGVEGWTDPTLQKFAKSTGRAGTIQPLYGAFAGKVFDITGVAGEGLRHTATSPAMGAVVGAGVGALTDEEDRFGGAMRGAFAGAAVGTAGKVTAQQLLRARAALRATGLPQELAEAYARSAGTIDFSGKAAQALARRARGSFKQMAQRSLAGYEDSMRFLDRLSEGAEAAGMAPERSVATALDRALGSQATAARALANGVGVEKGGVIDPITREIVNEPLEDVFAVLGGRPEANEQGLTYVVSLRRLGRYDRAATRARQWDTLAADAAAQAEAGRATRPAAGVDDPALAERLTRQGEIAAEQALGPRPNPGQVYGGDIAQMEADRATVAALGERPEYVEFASRLQQYLDAVGQYMVKSGVWTPQQYAAMRESDAFYIPFKRLLENVQVTQGKPMTSGEAPGQVKPGVKTFTGSRLMLANPAEALGEYVAAGITRADRYRVGEAFIETALESDPSLLTRIDANDPRAKSIAQLNAEEAYRLQGYSEDEAIARAETFRRIDRNNPVIWRNGPEGREYFLINDGDYADALTALNPDDPGAAAKAIVGVLAPLKRATTAFATGYSPSFWLGVNLPRDIITAYAQNPNMTVGDMAVGFKEAFKSIAGKSEMVDRITREGAGQVSQFGADPNVAALMRGIAPTTVGQQVRSTVGAGVTAPMRGLERVGRATEMPMRLAAARSAERMAAARGVSEAGQRALGSRAFSRATVDFRRKAGFGYERFLEQTVPFYGAAKKGGVAFARAAKNNPKAVSAAATAVVLGAALEHILGGGTMGGVFEGDEAARQEQTNRLAWERARSIQLGDFKLALPQELAVVAAATRVALASLERDDPFAYQQLQESLLSALPPVYSDLARGEVIAPFPVIRQLQEIAQNRSSFTGRPIVPESMTGAGVGRGVLPEQRRYPTTAPTFDVMAAAARGMGFEQASPLQAEYLMRGITGRFTPAVTALTDVAAQPITGRETQGRVRESFMRQPLNPLSSFVVQPSRRTQAEEEFYKLRNEIEAAQGTYSRLDNQYATAMERNDAAGVERALAEIARMRKDPRFEAIWQNTGERLEEKKAADPEYQSAFDNLEVADALLEEVRTEQELVQEAVANGRMTQADARKRLDQLNLQRAAIYRKTYDVVSKKARVRQ